MKPALTLIIFIVIWGAIGLSSFAADDAYIVFRYAENLVDHGALTFNPGEPVSALTSPLHALVTALLFALTGHTVLAYKVTALCTYLLTTFIVWQLFRLYPRVQLLALVLVALPPGVLLWVFGGLETPLLMLVVTAASAIVYRQATSATPQNNAILTAIFVLAGLAFLLRFDSILFFIPLMAAGMMKAKSIRSVSVAITMGAALPVAWLIFAYQYYGDVLPTSFYEKTPQLTATVLEKNLLYTLSYLLYSGIVVALLLPAMTYAPFDAVSKAYGRSVRDTWCLWVGLSLVLIYGLTMATSHMMFSFRHFVPYTPAAAIVALAIFVRASELQPRRYLFTVAVTAMVIAQVYQHQVTMSGSLNGLAPTGEFRNWGVRKYNAAMGEYEVLTEQIKAHWTANGDPARAPRITTFAAGLMPYLYREAYFYGLLVSYRHCEPGQKLSFEACGAWGFHQTKKSADYIVILAPLYGTPKEQLPLPLAEYTIIATAGIFFDGTNQTLLVAYNPNPEPHRLNNTIEHYYKQASP